MLVVPQQQMADFMRCSVAQYLGRGSHATFGECLDPVEENASVGPPFVPRRHKGETQRDLSMQSVSGRKTGEDSQNDLRWAYCLLTGQRSSGSCRLERAVKPHGLDSCFPKDLCGIEFRTLQGRA
jgi:hypothetical protein